MSVGLAYPWHIKEVETTVAKQVMRGVLSNFCVAFESYLADIASTSFLKSGHSLHFPCSLILDARVVRSVLSDNKNILKISLKHG